MIKSTAHSNILKGDTPASLKNIEMQEQCSLCERAIPDGKMVLRHDKTRNILCVLCLVEIAEIQ